MKAEELRLGNLVYGAENRVYTVDINILSILQKNWQWVEPIPLTPEWLERCGFEEDKQHECWVIWQTESHVALEYFDDQLHIVGYNSAEPLDHIKYVHQLQNLFYALTGTELTIKETVKA